MDNNTKKKEIMKKVLAGKGGPGVEDKGKKIEMAPVYTDDGQYAIDNPKKAMANLEGTKSDGKGGPGDMMKKMGQKIGSAAMGGVVGAGMGMAKALKNRIQSGSSDQSPQRAMMKKAMSGAYKDAEEKGSLGVGFGEPAKQATKAALSPSRFGNLKTPSPIVGEATKTRPATSEESSQAKKGVLMSAIKKVTPSDKAMKILKTMPKKKMNTDKVMLRKKIASI